ncbi:MAG TPA: glycosyltransferase family 2 protein [Acidobacteria bacterium]|nr:glycosyltransferase family 2 protein [Acidobacteriota bacterium]
MPTLATIGLGVLAALAWLAIAVALYAYVGYPLLARWLVRPRPLAPPSLPAAWPSVSVFIAARNEARVIRRRLENLLAQDYPGAMEVLVVSDASDDGTDRIVEQIDDPRLRLLRQQPRGGKTAGINRLGRQATGEIFIQTDANVFFAPGAVRALVEALAPPDVGVADGRVRFTNEDDPLVAAGEGLYWRFENWTKRVEAERGLLAVANGGIYALRRELWQPLPPFISGDAAEPLLAARQGFRTVIAEGALAHERAAASHREEFERKARIIAQQVACARWIGLLRLPPRIAWAYVSHKLLRYLVAPVGLLGLAAGLAAAALGSPSGALAAGLLAAPLLLAPFGLLPWPGLLGKALKVPLYLVTINLAAAAGLWRGLRGRAQATWEIPDSTRAGS